jgi:hypothetical protein
MERSTKLRGRSSLTRTQSRWWPALLLVATFLGCGGLVGSPQLPPSNITVTIAPATASVLLGEPQAFSATVSRAANSAVIWSVNGITGGNATLGTVDASGIYTASANLPAPASVSVRATSAVDATKSSAAVVTITSDISVSVSPQTMPVELGASRPFAGVVNSAGNPNREITWSLSGDGCSGNSCGIVDASGMYAAPQILIAPPVISLRATSVADPSKSSVGTIVVTSSFSLTLTGPSSVSPGDTAAFSATLTPVANSNPSRMISWSVAGTGCTGAACGFMSSGGVFTAPPLAPSPATVQIIATPEADRSKAASFSVSILPAIRVSVSPTNASIGLGVAQALRATVTGAQDTTVTWDVNGIVGGNSTIGIIQNSQTDPDNTSYASPQSMPAGGSVIVRARSNADPSVSASASINIIGSVGVMLTPASASLAIGERQTFSAAVTNTSNQNVLWQVNGISGGNSATGRICAQASEPCLPVSASSGGSIDYLAPDGLPSPNPVTITATSLVSGNPSGSASVTILPHVVVSVQPESAMMASFGQERFTATVTGSSNQQVTWTLSGAGCGSAGSCGSIDSSGLFSAPPGAPSPDLITIIATSSEHPGQSGTATVTISSGPSIFSLAPTSAYAGTAGGFTLLITGSNFSPSDPGPGGTILVDGIARSTSCAAMTQCITSLSGADLQSAGNLSVRLQNPDGSLSNSQTFVVLAQRSGTGAIPLTPSAPASMGNDIVVVELSTNGGSGAAGNVSLNIGAIGAYYVATSSCVLGGDPVIIQRPASGTGTADLCVFSVSGLSPSFAYTLSEPAAPDIFVINREPLGLGILHLTLRVNATALPGPRTLFVENPEGDKAAGTGVIEVR